MTVTTVLPGRDVAGYLHAYVQQMAFTDEDPAAVVDRYHAPGVRWFTDGLVLDRDKLVAHAGPVRKNAVACEVEVHDTLCSGDRVAARYTLRATIRKGRATTTEVTMFGRLAADGRLREIHQLTRPVEEPSRP